MESGGSLLSPIPCQTGLTS
jgi:hypothetical protein